MPYLAPPAGSGSTGFKTLPFDTPTNIVASLDTMHTWIPTHGWSAIGGTYAYSDMTVVAVPFHSGGFGPSQVPPNANNFGIFAGCYFKLWDPNSPDSDPSGGVGPLGTLVVGV